MRVRAIRTPVRRGGSWRYWREACQSAAERASQARSLTLDGSIDADEALDVLEVLVMSPIPTVFFWN